MYIGDVFSNRFDSSNRRDCFAIGQSVLRGPEKVQSRQFLAERASESTSVYVHTVQRGQQKLNWYQVRHAPDENCRINVGPKQPDFTVKQVSHARAPQARVSGHLEVFRWMLRENNSEILVKWRLFPPSLKKKTPTRSAVLQQLKIIPKLNNDLLYYSFEKGRNS